MYENRVVSASLDRRTTLNFYELPNEQGIEIRFPNVNLSLDVPLETVVNFLLYNDMVNIVENKTRLIKYVRHFITFNGMWSTHEQKFSLQIFFFLLSAFAYYDGLGIRPFRVDVSTDLSIGGGLGSSTSFAVCLAACFRHWARLQQGDHNEFDENDLSQIYHHTAMCEEFIQDFVFAIDNYVCINGTIIYSKCKNSNEFDVYPMDVPEMKILLINSNICQNNRERLQQMAKIKHNSTIYADGRLCAIDKISEKICDKLEKINSHTNTPHNPTSLSLQATTYTELQVSFLASLGNNNITLIYSFT
ncbi:mevalonate kinase [Lasius niger]|uniref:Mevalonate kinase n=1 Tax=Lasius niger TaxID=67767 RepID=A0A0J7MVP2_LASNI|nr:mevalonate kinase [Lasius niger]